MGKVLFEKNDWNGAADCLRQAVGLSNEVESPDLLFTAHYYLMECERKRGNDWAWILHKCQCLLPKLEGYVRERASFERVLVEVEQS